MDPIKAIEAMEAMEPMEQVESMERAMGSPMPPSSEPRFSPGGESHSRSRLVKVIVIYDSWQ